jgi:integrase
MSLLFRRSNGIYYLVTYHNGHRLWRSTGKRRRAEAEKFVRDSVLRPVSITAPKATMPELPPAEVKPSCVSFGEFIPQWRVYANTSFMPNTIRLYDSAFRDFVRLIGDKALNEYRAMDLEHFKAKRLSEVSSTKTNIDFATIKAFFNMAVKWDVLDKNPCSGVKLVKIPPQRPIYLTKEDFDKLTTSIKETWFREIVTFAVATMMRAGEIVNLTWDSIDLAKRVLLVENTDKFRLKTTQPRAIPMNEWVHKILSERASKTGYVFTFPDGRQTTVDCISGKFKKACRASGMSDKVHFHSLRHTGATWLVQSGAPIFAVQRILGHSDIKVTMRYAHLVTDELHDVVNKIAL